MISVSIRALLLDLLMVVFSTLDLSEINQLPFWSWTGHITTGSWKGRGNQYIEFARVLYCKLPTNGKQLPAFPHKAFTGIEPRPQRWEARVLPLCHRGPRLGQRILNVLFLVSPLLVISSLMYLEMSRKGAELAFSSRRT